MPRDNDEQLIEAVSDIVAALARRQGATNGSLSEAVKPVHQALLRYPEKLWPAISKIVSARATLGSSEVADAIDSIGAALKATTGELSAAEKAEAWGGT